MTKTPSFRLLSLPALAVVAAAALTACGGGGNSTVTPPATLGDTLAVTATGRVVSFNRATPGTLSSNLTVSGLASGETLVGIDVRPADGLVYAVSSLSRIYTLDATTGVLTLRSTLSTPLAGAQFGVDFNPVADRLRIVSNTGQNLRVDVTTGTAIVDGAINGASASITAAAYTNSFAGTTSTQLYDLAGSGTLYLQNPPNDGTLTSPVPLNVTFTATNGFDIDPRTNVGYAALTVGGANQFYTVPLTGTAGARLVGSIGTTDAIVGLTLLPPTAAPRAFVLTDASTLTSFAPATPNTLSAPVAITGLAAGETVLGIDFRPSNGRLYALTSNARLMTVNPDTGAGTVVATLAADATDTTLPYTALVGSRFTVDFNPAADRLRVIGNTGQNLRINVDTGATTTDGVINRAPAASVVAGAYTNSFAGTTATDLFDLDTNESVLARQTPPNDGTLVNVGPLGVVLGGQGALDIAGGANGLVLAALRTAATGPFTLYTLSLTTGAATPYPNATQSFIGGAAGPAVRDIAIRY